MTVISERALFQRNVLLLVLVVLFVISVVSVSVSIYVISSSNAKDDDASGKMNILFIVVDDLRPALGCYGDNKAITPNIDQIANKAVLFKSAYAQQALCAPSRTSFLTSRRPDSLHLYDTGSYWRDTVGNFTTLPQHFKNHGYETISIGKVFHHGIASNYTDDYPYSWTKSPFRPSTQRYKMDAVCPSSDGNRHMNLICPVDVTDQPEKSLPDIQNAEEAVNYLDSKAKGPEKDTPFFLGLGLYKPHIPFKFPKEYLDLYPIDSMDLAPNNTLPPLLPKVAWNPWTDIRERDDVKALDVPFPKGPLPENFQKLARQGYYSSLSYMDDQLGKVLEALEKNGYASRTIIVLLGDHGWSLGEHQEWSKYSNFEVSVNVPLLVHIPGITEQSDDRKPLTHIPVLDKIIKKKTSSTQLNRTSLASTPKYVSDDFVELVDIFPTLAEVCNIAIPPLCRLFTTEFCSEGISFYPVIEKMVFDSSAAFSWKKAAFSQYPRPSVEPQNNSDQPELKDITIMGYTMRNRTFRYTEWLPFDNKEFKPDWTSIISRELYDEVNDPFEVINISDDEKYSNVVIEMSHRLREGWRHALPPGEFDSPMRRQHLRRPH